MTNFACLKRLGADTTNRFYPSFAFEVTLINKKLIKLKSDSRSYVSNSLNRPNRGSLSDCQI